MTDTKTPQAHRFFAMDCNHGSRLDCAIQWKDEEETEEWKASPERLRLIMGEHNADAGVLGRVLEDGRVVIEKHIFKHGEFKP